ncbi:unnamed protein product, partial [Rhizoctonia solani]
MRPRPQNRDQRDRREQHDQQDRRDRRDRRDQRDKHDKRDRRDRRDHHGRRTSKSNGKRLDTSDDESNAASSPANLRPPSLGIDTSTLGLSRKQRHATPNSASRTFTIRGHKPSPMSARSPLWGEDEDEDENVRYRLPRRAQDLSPLSGSNISEETESDHVLPTSPNSLLVNESTSDDNSIATLNPRKMKELKLFQGDTIIVRGEESKYTVLTCSGSDDVEEGNIRMSAVARQNLGVRLDVLCTVQPCHDIEHGERIHIQPCDDTLKGHSTHEIFELYLKSHFMGTSRPVRKGDIFRVHGGTHPVEFKVVETDPAEYCIVAEDTAIHIGGDPPSTSDDYYVTSLTANSAKLDIPSVVIDEADDWDDMNVTLDSTSLFSAVLVSPESSGSSSAAPAVPSGVPFMGLETGFNKPSFSKVNQKAVSVQSKSIEKDLDVLREKDLLAEAETKTTRIRPILEVAQELKQEVMSLEATLRGTGAREPSFLDRVREIIDELEGLLELIHLPNARNDSSYQSLLDMSLSVLATLASSLFSSPESGNAREYFSLSKRSLSIAASYLPKTHPAKPIIASHWGTLYFQRFQTFGNPDHITQAIKFYKQSLKFAPGQAMFRSWLGRSYLARFEDSQVSHDLKKGIECNSDAWKVVESKGSKATEDERKLVFEGASRGLQCLIEHVGGSNSTSLINTGITEWRNTLQGLFKEKAVKGELKASCMRTLGFLYLTRFDQTGRKDSEDLDQSLAFLAAAVTMRPECHPELLSTLCVFAHSLVARPEDADRAHLAFDFLDLAKSLTESGTAFEAQLLASFGDLHVTLSREGADSDHLAEAIKKYEEVLKHTTCHPGSRLWAKVHQQLGHCRVHEYKHSGGDTQKLKLALSEFMHITLSPVGHLFDRFTAACSWASIAASHAAFRRHALYGYETALELIPLLACFGAVPDQRRKATRRAGGLATEAAATAIAAGENTQALALLERGRSLKWNNLLQLQSPLRTLKLDPNGKALAGELETLLKRLQLGETESKEQSSRDLKDFDLQRQYQDLLEKI